MSYDYFTTVKASPGFWEKLLMKHIDKDLSIKFFNNRTDEIIITTKNKHALDKIVTLSQEYPEEVFRVKVAGEDWYENYVYLYECSNGNLKLIKEGYEYCFVIKRSDLDRLDKGVYETFQKKVGAFLMRPASIPPNKVYIDLAAAEAQNEETDENLSVTIEYKTPQATFRVQKIGTTFINVVVDFKETKENAKKPENHSPNNEYDDLPY